MRRRWQWSETDELNTMRLLMGKRSSQAREKNSWSSLMSVGFSCSLDHGNFLPCSGMSLSTMEHNVCLNLFVIS